MSVKRYVAEKNNTITNAYKSNLITRGTGSNTGLADSLETFVIYGQESSSSIELSRMLLQFPIDEIVEDRSNEDIPNSGSVSFYLRMFNVEHSFTVPRNFTLAINAVSKSWDSGFGLDIDDHDDDGVSNWTQASSGSGGIISWDTQGGDYYTGTYVPGSTLPVYSAYFEEGIEDLEVDVTSLVEEWILNTKPNYGVGVYMTSSIETALSSSYTKRFSARGSEFFFKRPVIEARWDDTLKDNRGNFYASSSLASANDNLNTLCLYNHVRGNLSNISSIGTGSIYVKIYTSASGGTCLTSTPITGGYYATGIYTASFALDTTSSTVYDRWYDSGLVNVLHTGTEITVKSLNSYNYNPNNQYVFSISNLKSSYSQEEKPRFRVFAREKDWNPNIYLVASNDIETSIVDNMYYRIKRAVDDLVVIDYGTGSLNHTRLSYDASGSYFDFDMSMLESSYMYCLEFIYKTSQTPEKYRKVKDVFKFRVE